jgi:hypothetical protein
MAETWGDVMRARGIDPDAIMRRNEIQQKTCVVRALASVAGVPAPDDVIDLRLAQLNSGPGTYLDIAFEALDWGISTRQRLDQAHEQEEQEVIELVETWKTQDPNFARQLEGHNPQWETIDKTKLTDLTTGGVPVVVTGVLQEQGHHEAGLFRHAMHIGLEPETQTFVSKSDMGIAVQIEDKDQTMRALVFYPLE